MALVLVVESDTLLRSLLAEILQDAGYETLEAVDGIDGVLKAQLHRPDLILLEMLLPRLNGVEAGRLLRRDELTVAIPIVAMSTGAVPHARFQDLVDAVLLKPFDLDELLLIVALFAVAHPSAPADITPWS